MCLRRDLGQSCLGSGLSNLLPIVAGKVVECHGETVVVVLSQGFTLLEQLVRFLITIVSHVLDCKHVANVADLDADVRELDGKDNNSTLVRRKNFSHPSLNLPLSTAFHSAS